jgi:hypothetical protein
LNTPTPTDSSQPLATYFWVFCGDLPPLNGTTSRESIWGWSKPRDAANALGINTSTFNRLVRAGEIKCIRLDRITLYPIEVPLPAG